MKNTSVKMTLAACLLSVSLLPACGSNSSGGGAGPVNSGVPASKQVNTLTPAELAKLCAAVSEWSKEAVGKLTCELSGTFAAAFAMPKTDAEARKLCNDSVNMCLQKLSTTPATTMSCMTPPASCTVTVGEFETCLNELGPAFQQLATIFPSCDALSLSMPVDGTKPPPTFTQPPSCVAVQSKCPGVVPAAPTIGQ